MIHVRGSECRQEFFTNRNVLRKQRPVQIRKILMLDFKTADLNKQLFLKRQDQLMEDVTYGEPAQSTEQVLR